jgi:glucosamine 6-phosphate synthetase-like amidotransferase/phosphosugar isomerase protein
MCGQVGIVFGRKRRGSAEQDYLCEVFLRLLLHSEARGPHASGLAWLKTDGTHRIVKQPLPARELIYEEAFLDALAEVDVQTTVLMGHTRWRTRGDEANNANNHPIRAGRVIGTHNGTLYLHSARLAKPLPK